MAEALAWCLVALPVAMLLALILPWHLEIAGETAPLPRARLCLRLCLRPVSGRGPALLRLAWPGRAGRRKTAEWRADPPVPASRKHVRRRRLPVALLRALPGLIGRTLRGVEVVSLRLRGRFGLADPAETGMLWGRLCPLLWASPALRGAVALEPDFDGARLEGEGVLVLRLWPLWLIWPALRFALGEAGAGLRSSLRGRHGGRRSWSAM